MVDYSASTTEALTDGIAAFMGPFFDNLPEVLAASGAIILLLWGIRYVTSHFKGGKKH